jgi:hypothetical protein
LDFRAAERRHKNSTLTYAFYSPHNLLLLEGRDDGSKSLRLNHLPLSTCISANLEKKLLQHKRTKELNRYPRGGVAPRRCIHTLGDGSQCQAAAKKGSTRCLHHQLDARKHGRLQRSAVGVQLAREVLVASRAPDLLAVPFHESAEQVRRWESLGIVTRGRAKTLRYALQLNATMKRDRSKMRDNKGFGTPRKGI